MNQQAPTTASTAVPTTPVPVASGSTDTGAFNAGGLVFFFVTAVILGTAALLYFRNRSVARPADRP